MRTLVSAAARMPVAALKAGPDDRARSKPLVQAMSERPIASFADWDRVHQMRNTLVAFEGGNGFLEAGMLSDAMLRDDRVNGVLSTRASAVAGARLKFLPANGKRKAQKIAEELQGSDEQPGKWTEFCSWAAISDLLTWGHTLGIAVAEIVWTHRVDQWVPRVRPWHPQNLRWNDQEGRYYISTRTHDEPLPRVDDDPRSDGKWIIWTPYSYRNPWRRAFLRPLAMLYLARQWVYRDWSRYNEKHGAPADKVHVPEGASAEEKEQFYTAVANRGSDSTLLLPRGETDAQSYDVSILEATARSWESFKEHVGKLETDIAVLLLGQNLSTEVKEGSFAAAKAHGEVRLDKAREDAHIAHCLREQLLTWWALYNHNDADLAPRPQYQIEPPDDKKAKAETMGAVGTAITSCGAAGLNVDLDAIASEFGIPLEVDDEAGNDNAVAAGATVSLGTPAMSAMTKVNEARSASGLSPLSFPDGTPDPDGELTVSAYMAKHADEITKAEQAAAGTPPPPPEAVTDDGTIDDTPPAQLDEDDPEFVRPEDVELELDDFGEDQPTPEEVAAIKQAFADDQNKVTLSRRKANQKVLGDAQVVTPAGTRASAINPEQVKAFSGNLHEDDPEE